LKLISSFWDKHPIFWKLQQDIQTLVYTDNQYIDIYKIVLKSMYEVEKEWLETWVKKIEQLHEFLLELRSKEAEENKKEGDIDVRLNQALNSLQ
jgi:hypothetical protein